MAINSQEKGERGERGWAKLTKACGFPNNRRGQQYCGIEGQDCVGIPGLHQEVKWVESLNIDEAMAQAIRDASDGLVPIVAHRKNQEQSKEKKAKYYRPWKVTLRAEDFLAIYADALAYREMKGVR